MRLDLAKAPGNAGDIASVLEGTGVAVSGLVTMGLARAEDATSVLDFALFTAADLRALGDVGERRGRSLTEE